MIINLNKFIEDEKAYWDEFEQLLKQVENEPVGINDIERIKRFHFLYQRTSADLSKIATFASDQQLKEYLESLVARAYGEIYESRQRQNIFKSIKDCILSFPKVFRQHLHFFYASLLIMLIGAAIGTIAIQYDPDAKEVLMPFPHLMQSPSDRVAQEESITDDRMSGAKASFSSYLMAHNTRVSILTFALGMTWGLGTIIILFNNGVMLGAVCADYILSGEGVFLTGWLLPHGIIEIPAIIIAGQAGLLLGTTLIGWGQTVGLKTRLRLISSDLMSLVVGVCVMLIWAGFIESFFSQYHQPVLPYAVKIVFGVIEGIILIYVLWFSSKKVITESSNE